MNNLEINKKANEIINLLIDSDLSLSNQLKVTANKIKQNTLDI
jgi:hypothetical protein